MALAFIGICIASIVVAFTAGFNGLFLIALIATTATGLLAWRKQ